MSWAGHITRLREERNAYRLLVWKPEGKRPLGRSRRRWVANIRMDLLELGWGDVDWVGLAQDRKSLKTLLNSVLSLRVPSSAQLHRVSYPEELTEIKRPLLSQLSRCLGDDPNSWPTKYRATRLDDGKCYPELLNPLRSNPTVFKVKPLCLWWHRSNWMFNCSAVRMGMFLSSVQSVV
jgi:hypothetical protein